MPRIEQWSMVVGDFNPYQPPEVQMKCLRGKVYGRRSFSDGEEVTTSALVEVTITVDKTFVKTKNTVYELGEVDPAYEDAYPHALERLRASVGSKE